MNNPIQLTTTIPSTRNSFTRSPLRHGLLAIPLALALAWFALLPMARAVSPPPDGGYDNHNTAEGDNALFGLTSGSFNTATGDSALFNNTTGDDNTATGYQALVSNTTGVSNTATGLDALFKNTTGGNNTATGYFALFSNTTGFNNSAFGYEALYTNGNGYYNSAFGLQALYSNTTGALNSASGYGALVKNTTGGSNTGIGYGALDHNTTGSNNVALGPKAGTNLTTGSNNIDIAALGSAGESNTIRIGKFGVQTIAYMQGIYGKTAASGIPVIVNSNGLLGTTSSSARFKEEIKPMDKASEAILGLKPVTFRYKKELDPDGIRQFGLVAEQVEKVNPDLIARDADGNVYTVRYDAVNAMLLNEFLKEHGKVEEQNRKLQEQTTTITELKKEIEAVVAHAKEQDLRIQKVSTELELSRQGSQVVLNDR
jgi:Chaperone of endosialidase